MHSHLVAVKVRVERSADQRMQLDGAAFHQHRLERLNAKAMQRRRAVEHNGMALDDGFQRIPHLGAGALYHLAGRLDVVAMPFSTRSFITKGLNSSSAISLGRPHWYIFSSGPTTITERPE